MQYVTRTERVGEYLGPVDWSYDFTQHDWGSGKGGINPDRTTRCVDILRLLADSPADYLATTDGGWPKIGYKPVLDVGMYDGWPHWKPTPSVLLNGTSGPQWEPFYSISAVLKKEAE